MILLDFLDKAIGIQHYLVLSSLIFLLGVVGIFLNRKNVITILMSIELILLGVNINFVAFSYSLKISLLKDSAKKRTNKNLYSLITIKPH